MDKEYIKGVIKQFEYYKMLGEKTFNQLAEEDLFWKYNEASNSIAVIVNHLAGNMMSRWSDFLHTDGEKNTRNRDQEFEEILRTKEEMIYRWNQGWKTLLDTLESLTPDDLNHIVYIRNEGHTVYEAINRQLAHYPYHIGQIVFIGKMLKNGEWKSLSIPKDNSEVYNANKFSKEKEITHFTNDLLKNE